MPRQRRAQTKTNAWLTALNNQSTLTSAQSVTDKKHRYHHAGKWENKTENW